MIITRELALNNQANSRPSTGTDELGSAYDEISGHSCVFWWDSLWASASLMTSIISVKQRFAKSTCKEVRGKARRLDIQSRSGRGRVNLGRCPWPLGGMQDSVEVGDSGLIRAPVADSWLVSGASKTSSYKTEPGLRRAAVSRSGTV